MFAYSGGREYGISFFAGCLVCLFFAVQCVVGSTLCYCQERRGLKTFGFLMCFQCTYILGDCYLSLYVEFSCDK